MEKKTDEIYDEALDVQPFEEDLDVNSPKGKEILEVQHLLHKLPKEMLLDALGHVSLTVEQQVSHQQYSGPIPPPSMLSDYDKVKVGFAERIVSMAEKEQEHRNVLEFTAINGAITKDKRSQNYALCCVLFISMLCGTLIYTGHDSAGAFLGGSTLVGLTALFITGRRDVTKNNESEKDVVTDEPPE